MTIRKLGLMLVIILTSCTTTAHSKGLDTDAGGAEKQPSLSHLNVEFLYLAAEQAMDSGEDALAINFLKALVEKDAEAVLPRIQLVELLLQNNRTEEARKPVRELLAMQGLSAEELGTVRILQVQLLVIDNKQYEAVEQLRSMLRDDPDNYQLRLMLLRLLIAGNHYADAQRVIADGLKHGNNTQLYHIQAQIYIHQGMFKKAEQSLKTLMHLEPDQAGPVLMYSQLELRQNKQAEAEDILRRHLKEHPDALSVSNALGRLLVEQKRGKEAIAVYEDIAKRTNNDPNVLTALGLLYYQEKDFKDAADTFRRLLTENKEQRAAFFLAASLEALGQKDEARKLYQGIKDNDPNFAEAQLRMAVMDLREDRIDSALVTLRQLIRDDPKMADAYTLLSVGLLRKKAYQQLLDETEPALSLQSVQVQLLFNRATAFEELKQYDKAADQIKQLFSIEPENAEALNFLGYLYAEQGIHLDEAKKLILQALKKEPDNGYYLDSLAWVHYQKAEYAKALAVQRKAVGLIPNDPIMREHLGDILWKNGKLNEARATWKEAIKLGHTDSRRVQEKIDKGL
jgi:predicted Zn-dependent protease